MKKVILSIVDFFKNLFTAKKPIAKTAPTETELSKMREDEQELKDLFCKSENFETKDISKEITDLVDESEPVIIKEFSNHKARNSYSNTEKFDITIAGETYYLTEKQLAFYNIIRQIQLDSNKSVPGSVVAESFTRLKYFNLSESELNKLPKWKYKLSSHNKTMKFLYNSGIVYKVDNGLKVLL
jgi:hypothetical protein